MADQTRGKSPRRKPRPRGERKQSPGPTRQAQGEIRHDENREELLASMAPEDQGEDMHEHDSGPMNDDRQPFEGDDEGNYRDDHDSESRRPEPHRSESRGEGRSSGRGEPRRSEPRGERRPDRQSESRAEGRAPHNDKDTDAGAPRSAGPKPGPRTMPEEEFAVQVFFDRGAGQFVASCLEFPDLKVQGHRREDVVEELTQKIGDELEMMRREGRPLPAPFAGRAYPEKLDVKISRTLYRRLDMQSRQDRVPLDQLVTELLTIALNRRPEGFGKSPDNRRQQGSGQQQNKNQGNHNRRGGGQGGGGGGGRNRNYHDTMGNRDNFLEYVRNLEKGGGYTKKR
jgi:predicted RNase H-like HicB family nuclease